jgi:hypothetical protein
MGNPEGKQKYLPVKGIEIKESYFNSKISKNWVSPT